MIKNDIWITQMAELGMIQPFSHKLIRQVEDRKIISCGLSSYGYDIRLSSTEFYTFKHIPGEIVDPKNFNYKHLEKSESYIDESGEYFIIPGNSYGLGVAVEKLEIPDNITVIAIGKSTYARCFSGETKVKLVDGDYTFLELIDRASKGDRLLGYGVKDGQIVIQELQDPRFIENSGLVRVTLDDNKYFDCTPDHKILLRNGNWVEAQYLQKQDSLHPIYQHHNHGYPAIFDSVKADKLENRTESFSNVHHMVWDRSAFRRFPHIIESFKNGELCHNHKVASVEHLHTIQPTYCLTAPETGNFALSVGVFVSNCGIIANLTPGEACLHPDTEVLSRTGWKKIADVLVGEEILSLNGETAEYQAVQDFHRYYFNGELLNFVSKYVSQSVTPQHKVWAAISKKRVFVESGYASGKQKGVLREKSIFFPFERIEAQKIFKKHNLYFSRDVNWNGSILPENSIIGDQVLPTSAWLKFIGCWLGDGSAFVQGKGNHVIKLAVVTKEKKRDYFRKVLTDLGVNFWEGASGFEFRNKSICLFLKTWSGAHNKRIPRQYIDLCPDQLKLIREGMMMSDGNLESSTYVSVSKGLIEDFQEISLKIGDNTSVWTKLSIINDGNEFLAYCCRFSGRKTTPCKILPVNCEKIPYTGFVYDLTVPSHVFLVRHKNKVSWTGNSWKGHLTLEFSNSSPADCKIYANEGVVQLLFFEGEPCQTTYDDRKGKYQDQPEKVTIARL
jgi:dCTP deaminase